MLGLREPAHLLLQRTQDQPDLRQAGLAPRQGFALRQCHAVALLLRGGIDPAHAQGVVVGLRGHVAREQTVGSHRVGLVMLHQQQRRRAQRGVGLEGTRGARQPGAQLAGLHLQLGKHRLGLRQGGIGSEAAARQRQRALRIVHAQEHAPQGEHRLRALRLRGHRQQALDRRRRLGIAPQAQKQLHPPGLRARRARLLLQPGTDRRQGQLGLVRSQGHLHGPLEHGCRIHVARGAQQLGVGHVGMPGARRDLPGQGGVEPASLLLGIVARLLRRGRVHDRGDLGRRLGPGLPDPGHRDEQGQQRGGKCDWAQGPQGPHGRKPGERRDDGPSSVAGRRARRPPPRALPARGSPRRPAPAHARLRQAPAPGCSAKSHAPGPGTSWNAAPAPDRPDSPCPAAREARRHCRSAAGR